VRLNIARKIGRWIGISKGFAKNIGKIQFVVASYKYSGTLKAWMALKPRCHFDRARAGIAGEGEREILYAQ
jgi:hypothetical protein